MSFYPAEGVDISSIDFSVCTLLLPAVSVGNVGQLAIDYLLTSYKDLQFIGRFYDPANLIPFVANDAQAVKKSDITGHVNTGVEVFYLKNQKLVIVQQRTLVLSKRGISYVNNLFKWFKSINIGNIMLLTSSTSSKREDMELTEQQIFQFFTVEKTLSLPNLPEHFSDISSPTDFRLLEVSPEVFDTPTSIPQSALDQPLASSLLKLNWKPTKHREDMYLDAKRGGYGPYGSRKGYGDADRDDKVNNEPSKKQDVGRIPCYFPMYVTGGGITHPLSRACRRGGIDMTGLVALTYRGDNMVIAKEMAQIVYNRFGGDIKWKEPFAWKYIFGENDDMCD